MQTMYNRNRQHNSIEIINYLPNKYDKRQIVHSILNPNTYINSTR